MKDGRAGQGGGAAPRAPRDISAEKKEDRA